jgi:hypothetical protein
MVPEDDHLLTLEHQRQISTGLGMVAETPAREELISDHFRDQGRTPIHWLIFPLKRGILRVPEGSNLCVSMPFIYLFLHQVRRIYGELTFRPSALR